MGDEWSEFAKKEKLIGSFQVSVLCHQDFVSRCGKKCTNEKKINIVAEKNKK